MGNEKDQNNRSYPSPLTQNKDNISRPLTQEQLISIALSEKPKTRRQIELETGVHTNTLDWVINGLLKSDIAFVASLGICPVTGSDKVQFVTTNKDFRPKPEYIQKTLF